ncbi:MAG: hypothetical protein M0R46_00805 [Candidatus Muirbacterium halophilum]|nr:hypothetical protein [Candidatus Muirbacterium halophilum]
MLKFLSTVSLCLVFAITGCGKSDKINTKNTDVKEKPVEAKSINITPIKVRNDRKTGGDMQNNSKYPVLNISQVFQQAKELNGKRVKLIVYQGIRSGDSTDNIPPLMTRSDGYVHDENGTLMLRMGWQYSNTYNEMIKENPDAVYNEEYIKIDKGRWEITPIVFYKNGSILLSLKDFR